MAKNASLNVRISIKLKERLARLAEKEDYSIGQLVRIAVERYLTDRDE